MAWDDLHVEPGHYYSPVPARVDFEHADRFRAKRNLSGVDLRRSQQFDLARRFSATYPEVVDWLRHRTEKFSIDNSWFSGSDAITLTSMLLQRRPRAIVEVGCGHSTALLDDVNTCWFDGGIEILAIDPHPQRASDLHIDVPIIACPVQHLDFDCFDRLGSNDVLLIDSSHVLKTGSDVDHLFNEVLPRLARGVLIHVHDVFYPFEYPTRWFDGKVAFNEAYALELLLRDSRRYRIVYWNDFLEMEHRDWFLEHMPACVDADFETGGIWLEVI